MTSVNDRQRLSVPSRRVVGSYRSYRVADAMIEARIYLKEMFPLHANVAFALLLFLGNFLLVHLVQGIKDIHWSMDVLAGFITLFLFMLTMRIADEFKDAETDKVLFPCRPLPRGAVSKQDLGIMAGTSIVVILLMNVSHAWRIIGILLLFGYQFLTYKWFFIEKKMRASLFLAFVSHQPLALLVNAYLIIFTITTFNPEIRMDEIKTGQLSLIALLFWMPVLGWETSRKIKDRGAENDYTTYSKLLGPVKATILPLIFILLWTGIMVYFHQSIELPVWNLLILIVLTSITLIAYARFMISPTRKNNVMKTVTQVYFTLCMINLIMHVGIKLVQL